jgi:hypothetical protein
MSLPSTLDRPPFQLVSRCVSFCNRDIVHPLRDAEDQTNPKERWHCLDQKLVSVRLEWMRRKMET